MALRDDITAIFADATKTDLQRRQAASQIKVDALAVSLAGMVNVSWAVGSTTYRLLSVAKKTTAAGMPLLVLRIQRNGTGYQVRDTLCIANPPIVDSAGRALDSMTTTQRNAFGREMIGTLPAPRGR